ncbi:MAG: class I SAM-dependent methyltransferase [Acidobacteriota bacterium]
MAERSKRNESVDETSDSGVGASGAASPSGSKPDGADAVGLGVVQASAEAAAGGPPSVDQFLGEPTRELEAWSALFTHNVPFPAAGGGGLRGKLVALVKRVLRPFVRGATADLWDRQRVFNLIAIETLIHQRDLAVARYKEHQSAIERIDQRATDSLQEVMLHNDALFSRVDQKLDRYRREAKGLWNQLGALLAAQATQEGKPMSEASAESGPAAGTGGAVPLKPSTAAAILEEQGYLELEKRFRGSEAEIARRVSTYRPYLEDKDLVLDLGCGRGEALAVLESWGVTASGVDASSEMVARCRERGLDARRADLFAALAEVPASSLGGVVSFHVIEHLPDVAVGRLIRLAWRALRPGGVLILETPSPMALAMSARDFWLDPTHTRPVHPGHLEVTFREAGFEPVHRLDLHPFAEESHLPEIDLQQLPAEQHQLADQVNRLRDLLDDLLFGHRDFGMVGHKPGPPPH